MVAPTWATPAAWPAEMLLYLPDDGRRYELVKGVLVSEAMTAPKHGGICQRLGLELGIYARQQALAHAIVQNTLFDVTPAGAPQRTVLAPDIALMQGISEPEHVPVEAPFLAIEVVSPSQTLADLQDKVQYYLDVGTPEAWIIDPGTRVVEIVTLHSTVTLADTQAITSALLPGFRVAIAWLIDG